MKEDADMIEKENGLPYVNYSSHVWKTIQKYYTVFPQLCIIYAVH